MCNVWSGTDRLSSGADCLFHLVDAPPPDRMLISQQNGTLIRDIIVTPVPLQQLLCGHASWRYGNFPVFAPFCLASSLRTWLRSTFTAHLAKPTFNRRVSSLEYRPFFVTLFHPRPLQTGPGYQLPRSSSEPTCLPKTAFARCAVKAKRSADRRTYWGSRQETERRDPKVIAVVMVQAWP